MKLIKNTLATICFLFTIISFSQKKCSLKDLTDDFILYNTSYFKIQNSDNDLINLTDILLDKKFEFIGFIGNNKKRLNIIFNSIIRDSNDPTCYIIKGQSTVKSTNLRLFKGDINVVSNYYFSKLDEDPMTSKESEQIIKQGFSIAEFKLDEDSKFTATGVFKGYALIRWFVDKGNNIFYDRTQDDYDSYSNNQFLGTWTSYKTGKSSPVAWGQYRIPCSGDLDIGAAEFSPNEKYYKYGWADYKP
ncbi:hypothetical protein [Aquimarina longa]|uniref:hypothetical protein n=1 Tax=Aquimarina longa TaxID=1080221 RepID=UPI0007857611|nr:hypothetical protein [Aquimarina longa]